MCVVLHVARYPCSQDECGDWVTTLCPYGESGCPDNKGDYDVTMPMPMAGTGTGAVYKVGLYTAISLLGLLPPLTDTDALSRVP